jgi:hypothetical protein
MIVQHKRITGLAALALAVAAVCSALIAPGAIGGPPSCAISNARTHKGYDALQAAVDAAKAGDTLEIKGTCVGSTSVGRDITLDGVVNKAFPETPTLDGNQSGRVLNITAGKATIRGLAITNGRTEGDGGGILIGAGASAALFDSAVRANAAGSGSFGGGIEANGNLLLIRSEVTGNTAGSSGGIDMNFATVSLVSSTVTDNTATHVLGSPGDGCGFGGPDRFACGGGIWNFNGTLSLTDSTVSENTALYRGGGLRTSSTIQGGQAVAGITLLAGSTRIDDNEAGNQGGGIFVRLPQETASLTFRVADGSPSYTDPLTGSTLPAWTGSVSGNTPDQCSPVLTLGTHTCGSTFE